MVFSSPCNSPIAKTPNVYLRSESTQPLLEAEEAFTPKCYQSMEKDVAPCEQCFFGPSVEHIPRDDIVWDNFPFLQALAINEEQGYWKFSFTWQVLSWKMFMLIKADLEKFDWAQLPMTVWLKNDEITTIFLHLLALVHFVNTLWLFLHNKIFPWEKHYLFWILWKQTKNVNGGGALDKLCQLSMTFAFCEFKFTLNRIWVFLRSSHVHDERHPTADADALSMWSAIVNTVWIWGGKRWRSHLDY